MLKGVLFDMDGVLFDTERLYIEADRQAAADMGLPVPGDALMLRLCGASEAAGAAIWNEFYGEGFGLEAFRARSLSIMDAFIEAGRIAHKPGLAAALAALRESGRLLAVATSTDRQRALKWLELGGVLGRFNAVVGGDMVRRGKPEPDIYRAAAAALGLASAACAAVEDSYNGIRSAHAAGCYTIMVPDVLPPTPEMDALCGAILPSLAALPAHLATL